MIVPGNLSVTRVVRRPVVIEVLNPPRSFRELCGFFFAIVRNKGEYLVRRPPEIVLRLTATRPLLEAISSAGGVRFDAVDDRLMLSAKNGVFCAGEMLDWEAPTGGYLLTACFASGHVAARGVIDYLRLATSES